MTSRADIAKRVRAVSDRHDLWSVWSDFVEMSAISISNAVDWAQRDAREERYLAIVKRYTTEQAKRIAEVFGALTMAFEENEIDDVLGGVFMELELGSKWAGQFFTPFPICRVMAAMSLHDLAATIEARGFVTASDPAVGAGAMPLAIAAEMKAAGLNYQECLHVTAQDIDERAAHMAYIQLSLLHVPAVVVVGDTLRMETRARWYTPAHVLGGWSMRLARGEQPPCSAPTTPPVAPEPAPAAGQLSLFGGGK